MSRDEPFDDAVVGAGILGLAHAYHLARRGRKVVVFDRGRRGEGPPACDPGVIRPSGQPAGPLRRMALRSREVWLEVLGVSGLWHERSGSLHLAYHDDEADALRAFADRAEAEGFRCERLGPDEVRKRSPMVRLAGLHEALFSHWGVCVDPREVLAGLPDWLARERGVRFEFGRTVVGFVSPRVRTTDGDWTAERLWVCDDDAFRTLYPEAFAALGLVPRTLRVLRTAPLADGLRIGPVLGVGPMLNHDRAFEGGRGAHVMASQDGPGALTVVAEVGPSDTPAIDRTILDRLAAFLDAVPEITSRRDHTSAVHPSAPYFVVRPAPHVEAVTGLGGEEMTLAFGLAEEVVNDVLGGD